MYCYIKHMHMSKAVSKNIPKQGHPWPLTKILHVFNCKTQRNQQSQIPNPKFKIMLIT